MSSNTQKFEEYQSTIETKKLEISALETEIENFQLAQKKAMKAESEIAEERKRITTQVETLKKLRDALVTQVTTLK